MWCFVYNEKIEYRQMSNASELKMSVSTMIRTKDNKAVYVLFEDDHRSIEFALLEGNLVRNNGFSDDEITRLKEYVDNERDSIFEMAKKINPMRELLGDL